MRDSEIEQATAAPADKRGRATDPLMVMSVEKAFRVLSVFGHQHET